MIWGTTFSIKHSTHLDLNWKDTYQFLLNELNLKSIRLCAYWDTVEPEQDKFQFDDLAWQIDQAAKHNVKVTLAMGRKVPRWPEFHEPDWVKGKEYNYREKRLLKYIEEIVEHFRDEEIIDRWQVENEPFWSFGKSDIPIKESTVAKEVGLVRTLDRRKIVMTDTGAWSFWNKVAKYGDIVGVNIYPVVYRHGARTYFNQPEHRFFYKAKKKVINKPILVSELQAEPWGPDSMKDLEESEWNKSISVDKIEKNIQFVKDIGIDEVWLWGCEWWVFQYNNGNRTIFNKVKELTND